MSCSEKVIDAILDTENEDGGITIYPLTLARFAYLQKIESPLLTGQQSEDAILATAFIMTCPRDKLKKLRTREEILEAAMEWADTTSLETLPKVIEELVKKIETATFVAPNASEDDCKKKAPTAF